GSGYDGMEVVEAWQQAVVASGGACVGGSDRSGDEDHSWSWPEKLTGKLFRWPASGGDGG
ncbi:hypothetical protein Tco_1558049, partial [Tanacetum coccineum]